MTIKKILLLQMAILVLLVGVNQQLLAGDPPGTRTTGGPGNPFPEFCDEPCSTILTRWFHIEVTASPGDTIVLEDFLFQNIYATDPYAPGAPVQPLNVYSWSLREILGRYPNSIPHHGGHYNLGGQTFFHPLAVPGMPAITGSDKVSLWLEVNFSVCDEQNNSFLIPKGQYSIEYELIYNNGNSELYESDPAYYCPFDHENDAPREGSEFVNSNLTSLQAAPNPILNKANFLFDLAEEGACSLTLHNLQGQKVMDLMQAQKIGAGKNEVSFDLSLLTPGMYFARLETPKGVETVRIVKN